jgi:hypothetical protein
MPLSYVYYEKIPGNLEPFTTKGIKELASSTVISTERSEWRNLIFVDDRFLGSDLLHSE